MPKNRGFLMIFGQKLKNALVWPYETIFKNRWFHDQNCGIFDEKYKLSLKENRLKTSKIVFWSRKSETILS